MTKTFKYYMLLQEVKSSATEFNEAFLKQPAKKQGCFS